MMRYLLLLRLRLAEIQIVFFTRAMSASYIHAHRLKQKLARLDEHEELDRQPL